MVTDAHSVIHVVAADTPARKSAVLDALDSSAAGGGDSADQTRSMIVQVGHGSGSVNGPRISRHVRAPFDWGWLGTRALDRAVQDATGGNADPIILHVWSSTALAWCVPLAGPQRALLIEADALFDARRLARWYGSGAEAATMAFACPTIRSQRRLVQAGVPTPQTTVIRESVDFGALNRAQADAARETLGLEADAKTILVLPPVTRETGAFSAVWAAMVLEKVQADIRVIVPGSGREVRRIERLVESCNHQHVVRFDSGRSALPELLRAADLAAYLPTGDAPISSLVAAMAAGCPIIASAVPAVTELLTHGHNAWLCRTDGPNQVTRRMLQALERQEESRRQAEVARGQAFEVFGRQRMVEQYRRAYANLAAGRAIGDGIHDSALKI